MQANALFLVYAALATYLGVRADHIYDQHLDAWNTQRGNLSNQLQVDREQIYLTGLSHELSEHERIHREHPENHECAMRLAGLYVKAAYTNSTLLPSAALQSYDDYYMAAIELCEKEAERFPQDRRIQRALMYICRRREPCEGYSLTTFDLWLCKHYDHALDLLIDSSELTPLEAEYAKGTRSKLARLPKEQKP